MSQPSRWIAVIALSLVVTSTASAQQNPPTSRLFEVWKPHVAKRGNTPVLVHGVTSTSRDRFWVLVEVNNPDGSRKCEWLKLLEPKQGYRFECPLPDAADQKYLSRVRIFSDAKLHDREPRIQHACV